MFLTTPPPSVFLRFAGGVAALGLLLCNGCASLGRETQEQADRRIAAERARSAQSFKESIVRKQHQISIPELDQLTYGHADRDYMVISSAVDAIKHGNPDPLQRRRAHQINLNGVLSMDDIVSGNDPYSQILDLVASVTLQSIVLIDEDDAGIGFASVKFATARTRFVPLQASDGGYLLPSYENTVSGRYPLVRPMRIVFHRKPDGGMNPVAREFLRFAVSRRGQRIIALSESYPLTQEQQREALRVIGGAPENQSGQQRPAAASRR